MNKAGIMLSEISQTEKDKYHRFYLYLESKNTKWMNKTETHRYIEQIDGCQIRKGLPDGWKRLRD